jgi:hypothetical protein
MNELGINPKALVINISGVRTVAAPISDWEIIDR